MVKRLSIISRFDGVGRLANSLGTLMRIKNLTIRFLVGLLTFTVGVIAAVLWVFPHLRTVNNQRAPVVSDTSRDEELSLPEGWRRLEIRGKIIMDLPQDMKPELGGVGETSFAYYEAYRNQEILIGIGLGEIFPRRLTGDRPVDACETPRSLTEQPTYRESMTEIDGRMVKFWLHRSNQTESTTARICFPPKNRDDLLIVTAQYKNDRALETAQQIFTSIRFNDNR